ncbi:hypothetical protein AZH53_01810 [Methanomicrobiaceae archaeon CYW5]|uniref:hypothetical protein n=1 Tax=Methanovulcanius yangii TaxID=1789227 RepID=UPI0029CA6291|nr:hypothetical protein [Methanovulcanius yangii]MBT8507166.1 hypothetical protein [Methanovulcanius yangii]
MKKRQIFPLWSFGAEVPEPEITDLTEWVAARRNYPCDLGTYKVERSLVEQAEVDMPCYGGMYYRVRIISALQNVSEGFLRGEPALDYGMLLQDVISARKMHRDVRLCLPSPLSLGIEDGYYGDYDDFLGALCHLYQKLMRELRDNGIRKCIIIGERFSSIELEELISGKSFFFSPESTSRVLSSILEVQDMVAVPVQRLAHLLELVNTYEIRRAALIDACPEDFENALDAFDVEQLIAGGYSKGARRDYWNELKKKAYVEIDYF